VSNCPSLSLFSYTAATGLFSNCILIPLMILAFDGYREKRVIHKVVKIVGVLITHRYLIELNQGLTNSWVDLNCNWVLLIFFALTIAVVGVTAFVVTRPTYHSRRSGWQPVRDHED
jgi:uncharacterized membrane protein